MRGEIQWHGVMKSAIQTTLLQERGKDFDTHKAAMAAGRKKARELKASGSLPGGGVATVRAGQDSEVLFPRK